VNDGAGDFLNQVQDKKLDRPSWRVEFPEWRTLSNEQRRRLLVVIGDCAGEWWGAGRAEFWSRQSALEAIDMASDMLGIMPHLLVRDA
jgi:hypothetical protein